MKHLFKNRIFQPFRWMLAVALTACLLVLSVDLPVLAASTESDSSNVSWSLSGGVLTLSGSGSMENYTEGSMAPWYERREEITAVSIGKGITHIGDLAFYECVNLQSVILPSSVTSIGDMAFAGCTNLARVTLSDNLRSIGEHAFSRCESLTSIRFPEVLLRIGYQAFYRCSSLTSVRIPASTTNLESSIFAYCTSLMQATIESPITKLPEWMFYGCTSLVEVSLPSSVQNVGEYAFYGCDSLENTYHDGSETNRNEVSNQIQTDVPTFSGVTEGDSSNIGTTTTESTVTNPEGGVTTTEKEVTETDNSVINTTVEIKNPEVASSDNKKEYDITIDATIENDDGWDEVVDKINDYINYPDRFDDSTTTVNKIEVNVNLKDDANLSGSVLETLAGEKVNLNIASGDNSEWSIDCEELDSESIAKSYNLRYTITKNENPTKAQKKLIGDAESYLVEFEDSVSFKVTVKFRLASENAGQYATLCQKSLLKSWEQVQTVLIDKNGDAYFYLDSVDEHTEYLIAINMEGADTTEALISDTMSDDYGTLTDSSGNKYVLSGTQSSWGMSFGQVMLILLAVIVVSVVVVGLVMRFYFKFQKQKEELNQAMNNKR